MGDVYVAEDITLDRQVALKVLPSEVAGTMPNVERGLRARRRLSRR